MKSSVIERESEAKDVELMDLKVRIFEVCEKFKEAAKAEKTWKALNANIFKRG